MGEHFFQRCREVRRFAVDLHRIGQQVAGGQAHVQHQFLRFRPCQCLIYELLQTVHPLVPGGSIQHRHGCQQSVGSILQKGIRDFDRTLTAQNSTIPERNLEAIAYFMENGGAFTVNTGRSIPTFRQYLYTLPHSAPFLLYNGGATWQDGKLDNIREIPVPLEQVVSEVSGKYPDLNLEVQGV